MKYFIVSDVHSYYRILREALKEKGFDENNPDHTLVVLGDLLDRGPSPIECLNFVNFLPRKILIRGNHEDLLENCLIRGECREHDYKNGTVNTILDLADAYHQNYETINTHADVFKWAKKNKSWLQYKKSLIDYAEIGDHIFVYGWIPCISSDKNIYHTRGVSFTFDENWRQDDWCAARWMNGMDAWQQGIRVEGKTIYCGHWHTSWGHHYIDKTSEEWPNKYSTNPEHRVADFSSFIHEGIVAVDACTAVSHAINCFILEV